MPQILLVSQGREPEIWLASGVQLHLGRRNMERLLNIVGCTGVEVEVEGLQYQQDGDRLVGYLPKGDWGLIRPIRTHTMYGDLVHPSHRGRLYRATEKPVLVRDQVWDDLVRQTARQSQTARYVELAVVGWFGDQPVHQLDVRGINTIGPAVFAQSLGLSGAVLP